MIEKEAAPLVLATPEQIEELNKLLAVVKMPDDWQAKIWKAAGVDNWEDMDFDKMASCINLLKNRLPT